MPSRTLAIGWSPRFLVWSFGVVALLLTLLTFFVMRGAPAARASTFLKIDGVDGESSGGTHQNEIDIQSFSWGLSQAGSMGGGGGGGAGKVQFQDFHFSKNIDKSSPVLFRSAASGKHFPSAVLTARGTDGRDFMVIKLSDVLVSSFQAQDGGGSIPVDEFSLNYSKIEFEYRPTGSPPVIGTWDLKSNK
jgi:type VI secretion system secreted protein Hcp